MAKKGRRQLVVVFGLGVLLPAIVGCSQKVQEKKTDYTQLAPEAMAAQKVVEILTVEFGATTSWLELSRQRPLFTMQARAALIPSDGRSTVIIGRVIDVTELGPKGYQIRVRGGRLDLFLQSDEVPVQTILQSPHGSRDYFAAVVKASSVKKRLFSLDGQVSEDLEGTANVTIEPSEEFVVTGVCSAIRPLGKGGVGLAIKYRSR